MQQQLLSDVWALETPDQENACDYMNFLFDQAMLGKVSARNLIKKCYGDVWPLIKERMMAEGSTWYVWYMDGVNKLLTKRPNR